MILPLRIAECGLRIFRLRISDCGFRIGQLFFIAAIPGPSDKQWSVNPQSIIRNPKSEIRNRRIRNPKSAIRNSIVLPLLFLLFLPIPIYAQNPGAPSAVYVTSPQPRLISGQKVQLSAIARDASGVRRPGDNFTWSSSNSQILSVDSNGLVTARQLGFANITAAIGNVRGVVRLQVLPLRVNVTPNGTELFIGETLQYNAVALDINETPIPQVTFQWRVTGANGGQTNAAGITPNGLLTASAIGSITIRAVISYPVNQASEFVKEYFGLARLRIKLRNDFSLTRLLSTEDVGNSFHLRPYYSEIAANDAGQVAFVGNLDGLATGLLLYDRDKFQLLASAGIPGPIPGGIVADFSAPAINNRGEVLTRSAARGSGWGLLLGSSTHSAFALVDGQTDGSIEGLGGITITRYSLNDAGDILFRANFRFTGSNTNQTGVFRLSKGSLQVLYASSFPLPGLSGTISVDNQFGIDRDGVAYFSASSGASRVLYRQPEASPPTKVIAINDAFAGSTIRDFYNLVIGGSDIAFGVNLNNGSQYIVRYPGGAQSGQVQSLQVQLGRVLSTSSAGVLFDGNAGRGWGLYRWQNDLVTPLLMLGRLAPNGEPVRYVEAAAITAQGEVFAQARTAENEFVVMKLGATNSVLFQAGDRVDVAASLNFGNLVGGSSAGPIYVLAGGGRGSLFELDDRGLIPRVVLGDRLPGSASFSGTGLAKKNASGNLYFAAWEGIYRLTGEQVETIVSLPLATDDGTTIFAPFDTRQFSVNGKGALAWVSGTNKNHTRLYLTREGRHTLLAFGGRNSAWQTPSPTGSAFDSFNELAIDEAERIMVFSRLRDGASGFFMYSNGQWQTAALMNATQVGGQNVVGAFQLKALGDRFYALFNLPGGGSTLAEFRDQNWIPLASRGDITPNGNTVNFISSYDVNRNGEVAFIAGLNPGSQAVLLRSSGGLRLVYLNTDATEAGDQFSNSIWEISLRDDRRILFTGLDLNDRYLLYGAEPLL